MITFTDLQEGVYDPNIFKAFFLAGGPGSGKSYVVRRTTGGMGMKIVISDDIFEKLLDKKLQKQNKYYKDLVEGSVIGPLKIERVLNKSFNSYMKSIGKFGGQNKVPNLSNDRVFVDGLKKFSK